MQTFIIIMGAGRCGTSSTISFLNKKPDFDIYGENKSVILSILEQIYLLNDSQRYKGLSSVTTNASYIHNPYIGTEWYNPDDKILKLKTGLINLVKNFFNQNKKHIGFKEIRWAHKNLQALNLLESLYRVKYIHLTRNIKDQISSMTRLNWTNVKNHISHTNDAINNFLLTKQSNQYIKKNISVDKNFLEDIYNFIVADE